MKVRYRGPDIGVDGLVDGHVYKVLREDELTGYLAVVDESGEDYLYHPKHPKAFFGEYHGGYFEIVEDDAEGTLDGAINWPGYNNSGV